MSTGLRPLYTYEEYLLRERDACGKSAFYRGQIFPIAGGSIMHNRISGNIFGRLHGDLRGTPCLPLNSDQRIRVSANGLATYPDVSVVCGELEVDSEDVDAITNPRVIFEVLSPTSESYDRGKKFDLYRQLESLQEYILVSQEEAQVERFVRQSDGSWILTLFKGLDSELKLESLGSLPLSEIYENVNFGPDETIVV